MKWTEEQVQTIRMTSKANFREGLEVIRLAVREAYERRKKERVEHEGRKREEKVREGSGAGNGKVGKEVEGREEVKTQAPASGEVESKAVEGVELGPVLTVGTDEGASKEREEDVINGEGAVMGASV